MDQNKFTQAIEAAKVWFTLSDVEKLIVRDEISRQIELVALNMAYVGADQAILALADKMRGHAASFLKP